MMFGRRDLRRHGHCSGDVDRLDPIVPHALLDPALVGVHCTVDAGARITSGSDGGHDRVVHHVHRPQVSLSGCRHGELAGTDLDQLRGVNMAATIVHSLGGGGDHTIVTTSPGERDGVVCGPWKTRQ